MNVSALFIKRPVMTVLVMAAILIAGLNAYKHLSVSDLPNVDFPTILVTAMLPGASPETMASAVATPLEKQFSTIAGVDSMTSVNMLGVTTVTIQFNLNRNIDAAAQDVSAMITKAMPLLPPNMPIPPIFQKVNPADQPILYLALRSDTLPLSRVNEYAETTMSQRISTISGVAQVNIFGAQKYAVRIQLDPDALAAKGIGIDQVATAVQNGNVNLPTGYLDGRYKAVTINALGQLYNASEFNNLIVAHNGSALVRIRDIGRAVDDVQDNKAASWYRGSRAVILAIQRQPGTNTVEVVNAIKTILPQLQKQIPAAVKIETLYDRSISIREAVNDVKFTLGLAICLVVMVIFLFLRNIRATIIPSLALPMSVIGTFACMYLLDYSIDTISMMAMTLSVGFVVDDAIVMLENIVRHTENGEDVHTAAMTGSKEIGFTILSMTLSLIAVFIPVLFMGGILGRLLHEFAVTISMAILVSGIVSLTLTPMLCNKLLKSHVGERHNVLYNMIEGVFNGMLAFYRVTLKAAIRARIFVLILSFLILFVTIYLFGHVKTGFLPSIDTGQIFAFTEAIEGISFESMKEHQKQLAQICAQDPNIETVMSSIGGGGMAQTRNMGRIFMRLKPRKERKLDADEIIQELKPKFSKVAGIQIYLQNLPIIRIGGMLTKSMYQYTLQGPDTNELYKSADEMLAALRKIPELTDVTSDMQLKNPQIDVVIDRDAASTLGISAAQIEMALMTAYSAYQVSTIYTATNQYWVIQELDPKFQVDPAQLSKLKVRAANGTLVPLEYVARFKNSVGPMTINHLGQLSAVTISFNLKPGVALSEAMEKVEKAATNILPQTINTSFQGTAQAFKSSFAGLGLLLLMAVVVIYIVLGILYESFIHPLTILSGLPSAGIGALLTLFLFRMELNIYAFVGIIMLLGIVKKNAIMMIDFAIEARNKEDKSAEDAIFEGCMIRFRPIMMTTMAALIGTLPVALGIGTSSDAYRPLGMAVVGGLLFSQLLTLYITPVVYIYLDRLQNDRSSLVK